MATDPTLSARERRLIEAIASPVIVIAAGNDAVILAANPAARRLLGERTAARRRLAAALGPDAAAALARTIGAMALNGAGAGVTLDCGAAGAVRFELARDPKDPGLVVATLRPEAAAAGAADERAEMRAVLESLPVGVELYDRDFNALFYNSASDALFDYAGVAIAHHDHWWRLAFPDAEARRSARGEWRRTVAAARADPSRAHMAEWTVRTRDGGDRVIQFFYRFLGERYALVLWDVTEQRRLEAELRSAARTDALTGAANRRRFVERLAHDVAAARAGGGPLALIVLDIDHFKAINDRFGHAAGDDALRAVAERAARALRRDDMLARVGGEEFAALLPRAGRAEAQAVAERLHAAVAGAPIVAGAVTLGVTVSLGVALLRDDDRAPDDLFARADAALYAAKASGRNRVVFEEP
ncbi:diguanylate cyclase [Methylopila henanensis]|uniref:diguanylate cyclase n=1 Tax=Methylopila henanensis TaxID=873516 RepID=A0ABW4KDL1_9HYPH